MSIVVHMLMSPVGGMMMLVVVGLLLVLARKQSRWEAIVLCSVACLLSLIVLLSVWSYFHSMRLF